MRELPTRWWSEPLAKVQLRGRLKGRGAGEGADKLDLLLMWLVSKQECVAAERALSYLTGNEKAAGANQHFDSTPPCVYDGGLGLRSEGHEAVAQCNRYDCIACELYSMR